MDDSEDECINTEQDLDRVLFQEAPPCKPRPFEDICDFIEQKSITFRLFRNELEVERRKSKRGRTIGQLTQGGEHIRKNYFVPLPKNRSYFNRQEMKDLYAVFAANINNKVPTPAQVKTYTASIDKIQKEKDEFCHIVKQRWLQDSWSRTTTLNEDVGNFIELWWEARINRVKNYPPLYSKVANVSLSPSTSDETQLKFIKTLLLRGKATRYHINPLHDRNRSLLDVLSDLINCERAKLDLTKADIPHHLKSVSQDATAEELALGNNAQIVTTPSAILSILGHTPLTYEESWFIPFTVKEYHQGDHTSKIIFMDKKLPPKSLSATEKNCIFAKYAARALFSKSGKSLPTGVAQNCDADPKDVSVEEDVVSKEAPNVNPVDKLISYDLWECAALDAHSVLSKHHKKTFKLLIRTCARGFTFDKSSKNSSCVMLPKLDYQPEYGAEVVSFKEMMREWLSVTLRPGSVLHRVRVDPMRGETIMTELKTANELANDCQRLHSRSVHHQLSILQTLLESISGLPTGSYVLTHEPSDKGFMFVYHQQGDSKCHGVMNLSEAFGSIDVKSTCTKNAPWIPIDSTIITPTLEDLGRIPCALPPAIGQGQQRKVSEGNLPPKKKKKKKKKNTKSKNGKPQDERAMITYDDQLDVSKLEEMEA